MITSIDKFKLASREYKNTRTVISIKKNDTEHAIGGDNLTMIAGPCSVESEEQIHEIAHLVASNGAHILRGGAFKPRTSPYDFQGLGEEGLRYLKEAAEANHLLCVSEVMDTQEIDLVAKYVDILQIGARNMQNFSLLKQIGRSGKPIMLKRGLSARYTDLLMAAEYILESGNPNVILCERGIRTFETYTRNTLDISAILALHQLTHLPVIVDPSHGTGIQSFVPSMTYAALVAGANGVMVEVHPEPNKALSDGKQTLDPIMFQKMMQTVRELEPIRRRINTESS